MIENEQHFKEILLSGPLQELNFYQVNDNFFEFSEEGYWIIDAGIELKFPSGIISAAWEYASESYVMSNEPVKKLYSQNNLFQLENENILNLNKFVGLNVAEVDFKIREFEYVADYTMRIEKENRFVELIIEFQNKGLIQIAFIDYTLEENKAPTNFSFDVSTEILVSTKKIFEVKYPGEQPI